jgi:hypothetical protein
MEFSPALLFARWVKDDAEALSPLLENIFKAQVGQAKPLRESLDLWKCEMVDIHLRFAVSEVEVSSGRIGGIKVHRAICLVLPISGKE